MKVEAIPVTRWTYRVEIDGKMYDAADLYETLNAVEGQDVIVNREPHGEMLLTRGVLTDLGSSRWMSGATKGPAYQEFMDELTAALEEAGWR